MEWFSKLPDLLRLPTRYFALVAFVTGCLLLLPKTILERLHLDTIPDPYGAVVGVVFLTTTGIVIVNVCSRVAGWVGRNRRRAQRTDAIHHHMLNLDPAEQAVLREFFISGQSTHNLPLEHPVVAGLTSKGILLPVGRHGRFSMDGMMLPFRISEAASALAGPAVLGLERFTVHGEDGQWDLTQEGFDWVLEHRPEFAESRRF